MDAIESYDLIRTLGVGVGGRVARLMRYKPTNELLAVKFIPRGERIDRHVAREIMNHRSLRHPNIVLFRRAFLTPTHLALAMDFAAGGELLEVVGRKAPMPEDKARFFFQQLIAGVGYLHSMHVFHRDLKLDNIVLDSRGENPRLKICDFGYSKSGVLHSRPNSMVGTPAYIAPEVLTREEYDGGAVDVWACGVILYLMVVGDFPFQDEEDKSNIKKIVERVLAVQYRIPGECRLSLHCKQLISAMLVKDPKTRIRIAEIRKHPWFVKDSSAYPWFVKDSSAYPWFVKDSSVGEVGEGEGKVHCSTGLQSVAEITRIVEEARRIPTGLTAFETLKIMEAPKMRPKKCRSTG